jgi:hypothetical protein
MDIEITIKDKHSGKYVVLVGNNACTPEWIEIGITQLKQEIYCAEHPNASVEEMMRATSQGIDA